MPNLFAMHYVVELQSTPPIPDIFNTLPYHTSFHLHSPYKTRSPTTTQHLTSTTIVHIALLVS